jgi:hypothetical protein
MGKIEAEMVGMPASGRSFCCRVNVSDSQQHWYWCTLQLNLMLRYWITIACSAFNVAAAVKMFTD